MYYNRIAVSDLQKGEFFFGDFSWLYTSDFDMDTREIVFIYLVSDKERWQITVTGTMHKLIYIV